MRGTDIKASIRHASWPEPSPELRARVLRDSPLVECPVAWTDRIWFSRGWRLSLTTATFGCAALIYVTGPSTIADAPTPGEVAKVAAIEETMREAGVPPDEAAVFARRTVADSRLAAWSMYSSKALHALGTLETNGGRR